VAPANSGRLASREYRSWASVARCRSSAPNPLTCTCRLWCGRVYACGNAQKAPFRRSSSLLGKPLTYLFGRKRTRINDIAVNRYVPCSLSQNLFSSYQRALPLRQRPLFPPPHPSRPPSTCEGSEVRTWVDTPQWGCLVPRRTVKTGLPRSNIQRVQELVTIVTYHAP
jgi:hypothetical protein